MPESTLISLGRVSNTSNVDMALSVEARERRTHRVSVRSLLPREAEESQTHKPVCISSHGAGPPGEAQLRELKAQVKILLARYILADPETGVAPGETGAAICVQNVDVQCVLQFTLIHAAGCVLHRHTSRVIHRLEFSFSRLLHSRKQLSVKAITNN